MYGNSRRRVRHHLLARATPSTVRLPTWNRIAGVLGSGGGGGGVLAAVAAALESAVRKTSLPDTGPRQVVPE